MRGAAAVDGAGDDDAWMRVAGADLIGEALAIAACLRAMDGPLDIGGLAYLDGERRGGPPSPRSSRWGRSSP